MQLNTGTFCNLIQINICWIMIKVFFTQSRKCVKGSCWSGSDENSSGFPYKFRKKIKKRIFQNYISKINTLTHASIVAAAVGITHFSAVY